MQALNAMVTWQMRASRHIIARLAHVVENYVTKGQEIALEGKLTNRSWEDKNGNKRYITEIVCNELLMLGK